MVHQRFYVDRNLDYEVVEEKQEVCLDREMCGIISTDQGVVDETLIIKFPDMDEDFLVCADASKEGLGGVLMQDGRVITYISINLRNHEENYMKHDSDLLATMYCLESVGTLPNWMEFQTKKIRPLWFATPYCAK
jgi:hypothetical protein